MGGIEIVGICIIAVNLIWGLVWLTSKGLSAEAVTVMTAAIAGVSTLGGVYVKLRRKPDAAEDAGDGGQ